jgi:hypothetical protein
MSERPSCSEDGAVAYIGVWSMNTGRDSELDPNVSFRALAAGTARPITISICT